jgi:hypothetical protein
MARKRQGRRCKAHRKDGAPCAAWAIVGGYVCWAHGGATQQARAEARIRVTEADIRRAFQRSWDRYLREYREWQTKRVAEASMLLGMPVADFVTKDGQVNEALIQWCRIEHGRPDALETAPEPRDDRRFRAIRALEATREKT